MAIRIITDSASDILPKEAKKTEYKSASLENLFW